MEILRNITINNKSNPILLDVYYKATTDAQPLIIFNHGFKGFKDWGYWHIMAQNFAKQGFIFIKFNQSHNGTTQKNPSSFDALELFAKNTYTQELLDIDAVLNWVISGKNLPIDFIDTKKINLMGHSRGASTSILYANGNNQIHKVIAWAPFKSIEVRYKNAAYNNWKEKKRIYINNARTNQKMPQDYLIMEDYLAKQQKFNILNAARELEQPLLLVHGIEDPTVDFNDSVALKTANENAELYLIPGANHVFGGFHPYNEAHLPNEASLAFNKTLQFL